MLPVLTCPIIPLPRCRRYDLQREKCVENCEFGDTHPSFFVFFVVSPPLSGDELRAD